MLDRFFPPVNPDPEVVMARLADLLHARGALFTSLRRLRSHAAASADNLRNPDALRAEWTAQLGRASRMIDANEFPEKFRNEFNCRRNWLETLLAAATGGNHPPSEASICFRQLPRHTVTFPVAAIENADEESNGLGRINRMTLELFRSNDESAGCCLAHPLRKGLVFQDDAFTASVDHAWRAATGALGDQVPNTGSIVTFRGESQNLDHLTGPSAGGAFALAILRLLRRQPYDPAILVIATIDHHGVFGPVSPGGLCAKVKAAVADGNIDTIATVPDHADFVRSELERLQVTDSLRVCSIDYQVDEPQGAGV